MADFKTLWVDEQVSRIQMMYPNDDESEIRHFVEKEYDDNFQDAKCVIYNNYEKETINTTLSKVTNWINKKKPITTESGTLFKQHEDCWNPDTQILENKLGERKVAKKKMFEFVEMSKTAPDKHSKKKFLEMSDKYNMIQKRIKIIVNSEYGVSGLRSSWFFNLAASASTTARGQNLISTAETAFEDFLADNIRFMNMDECIYFIQEICNERGSRTHKDNKWVENKSILNVVERLRDKFLFINDADTSLIEKFLTNLGQEDLNRIYYKSNLEEFFRNSRHAQNILSGVIATTVSYLEPMKPPDIFKERLKELREAVLEYVHFCHPTMERVCRLRAHMRKRVITIDTDSNFLNLGPWIEFVQSEIMSQYQLIEKRNTHEYITIESRDHLKRSKHLMKQDEIFRIINSTVFILTEMIDRTLIEFMHRCNLRDMSKNRANMKNEFLYTSILLTDAKKHYQGVVQVQEGHLYETPKLDVKGMEYIKPSMGSKQTRNFIKDLVYKDILMAEDAKPDIANILTKLRKFEKGIKDNILNGDYSYFKTANIKTADAYDDPWVIGSYKATYIWNYLNPDNKIDLPGIAYIAKVKLDKLSDAAFLSVDYPEIYSRLESLFNEDIEVTDRKNKCKKTRKFGEGGIAGIALPLDSALPEWLKPFIDTTEITMSNTKLVLTVLNSLGISTVYNSKAVQFVSNIVKL